MKAAGMALRTFREARGLNQEDAGNALGFHGNQIGVWERGTNTPRVDRLDAYAELVRAPIPLIMELVRKKTAAPIDGLRAAVRYLVQQEGLDDDDIAQLSVWRQLYGDKKVKDVLNEPD